LNEIKIKIWLKGAAWDATQCSCHHIPNDSNLQKVRFSNLTLKQHVLEIILNYYMTDIPGIMWYYVNSLNTELNPICHLLALLGAHHILHISRIKVKYVDKMQSTEC
jgi:hypothetical protein